MLQCVKSGCDVMRLWKGVVAVCCTCDVQCVAVCCSVLQCVAVHGERAQYDVKRGC